VIVTMPGTGLPLPYQLSSAKERAERRREASDATNGTDEVEDRRDAEQVAALVRLFGSLKPGLPIPRELLDHDTALIRSTKDLHRLVMASCGRDLLYSHSSTCVRAELIQSEIVVSEGYWRKRTAYFKQQNERARHELQTAGYTILKNLVRCTCAPLPSSAASSHVRPRLSPVRHRTAA
jgi:hypothetical protein